VAVRTVFVVVSISVPIVSVMMVRVGVVAVMSVTAPPCTVRVNTDKAVLTNSLLTIVSCRFAVAGGIQYSKFL
jgi:hypothetical protein